MNKDERKEVDLGDIVEMLSESMTVVSKVAKSGGEISEELVEKSTMLTDIFEEKFSRELINN